MKKKIIALLMCAILSVGFLTGCGKEENNNSDSKDNENITGKVDPDTVLTYDNNGAFLLPIEDVFTISGKGTVVTGRIDRGTIRLNDEVQIIGLDHEIITTTVIGIEMYRKSIDYAETGNNVGLTLKGVSRDDIERGQVLAKPNSIKASTKFDADVYIFTKEEGGSNNSISNNSESKFYFRTAGITGKLTLLSDADIVNPGDNTKMTVELEKNVAMEVGTTFSIRNGSKTIGKGTVTKVY